MSNDEFMAFINAQATTRGGLTFNLNTANCSKQAQAVLREAGYGALAKAHINANIINAYREGGKFADKLDAVLSELNITLIA